MVIESQDASEIPSQSQIEERKRKLQLEQLPFSTVCELLTANNNSYYNNSNNCIFSQQKTCK